MWGRADNRLVTFTRAAASGAARAVARVRRLPLSTILVFGLALAWIGVAGSWAFVQTESGDTAAQRYQQEVAKCRELPTSEARYDCVSRALISRDRENFGKAMLVFIPPVLMIFGRYVRREIQSALREREHARLAEARSRRHLAQLRRELNAEREALKPAQRAGAEPVATSWAEEIAQAPRRARRSAEPAHAPSVTHASEKPA